MDRYNFAATVEQYAMNNGEQIAVYMHTPSGDNSISYAGLTNEAAKVHTALVNQDLQAGDRVLVLLTRGILSYAIYLGLNRMGAVTLPASEMLRAGDISYRVRHAQVKAVITAPHLVDEVSMALQDSPHVKRFIVEGEHEGFTNLQSLMSSMDDASLLPPADTDADDRAYISYTSGTTGGPKGVVHVHGWARAHIANAATYWFDVQPGEWAWATAGPGWAKWVWSPFTSILGKGGTAFVYTGRFEPDVFLDILAQYPIGLFCSTPTEYRLMAKSPQIEQWQPKSLRSAVSAGEPLNREVIDIFYRRSQVMVRDGYGQTENSLLVSTQVGMEVKKGSMGKPSPLHQVTVIDEDGNPLPVGQVGDIAVHRLAPTLFKEYLYDAERTAKAYRRDYYVTGDLGRFDEDGYLWFEGRADDIIISAGYTIGPFEVEDALVRHVAVAECAAVASPDPERGHIVKAFVVLKANVQGTEELIEELQNHVKTTTAPYKYPREIEFVSQLPKTTSGKIRRVELRTLERQRKSFPVE